MTTRIRNPIIISLAILKLNWDVEGGKSYLDNFVPIVAECIRLSGSKVVSVPEVRSVLQKEFGLTIPLNSLEMLLRRVKARGYIYIRNGIYRPVWRKLNSLSFREIQQSVLEMHDALVTHLKIYVREHHNVEWTQDQAEEALLQFLEGHDLVSLSSFAASEVDSNFPMNFLVGSFIQYLLDTHSPALEYLETVVKGNMLANALFLTVPGKELKKFRQTQLFFDTPFLMYLIGHAGPERQEPCKELISLLENSGALLRCFRHTVDEAKGILEAIGHRMHENDTASLYGPSVDYFLMRGLSSSDVFLLRSQLERDIESFGIRIVERPDYAEELHPYVIDELELKRELQERIKYRNESALDRDVESIAAIMRLRKGRYAYEVEDSPAVLVTTNSALCKVSRDFIIRETGEPGAVPPAITDKLLTNLLWLKRPFDAPDLPRKRIIADCYAAVQPSDRLWAAYIQEVEELEQRGNITADDYYVLRYSLEARKALMEVTLGDEAAFSQGSVDEILQLAKERIQESLRKELEAAQRALKDMQQVKEELEARLRYEQHLKRIELLKQRQRVSHLAQRIAFLVLRGLGIVFGGLLLVADVFSFWSLSLPTRKSPFRLIVALGLLALFLFTIVDIVWGSSLTSIVKRGEVLLSRLLEKYLYSMMGLGSLSGEDEGK